MGILYKYSNHPLQTNAWARFRTQAGNFVLTNPKFIMTIHKLPFMPFSIGLIIKGSNIDERFIKKLRNIAKRHKLVFIRLEPNVLKSSEIIEKYKKYGLVPGRRLFTPSTFVIDLSIKEEELLMRFESKTRYNIRLATKKGVIVKEDNSDTAFNRYLELTKETVERQKFYAHTPNYHKLMWKQLHTNLVNKGKKPIAGLITANFNNEIISTWILLIWKDTLYYPYGASSEKYKNVMANNLMMWEAIKYGQKNNLKKFDLWGRDEGKGFTKFKEGYKPQIVDFVGTWDLPTHPLYILIRLIEKVRWFLLRIKGKFVSIKF